ncbi:MAG: hypothetical protein K2G60_03510 [Oscillospiraceae bacterium]|nr:hypothetical protein [Oscillospiraceae bacterium]
MKCTKCGKELDENVKCCDECGTQVCKPVIEHTKEKVVNSPSKDLRSKINELPTKTKIFAGIGGALIIVLMFVFLGALGSKPINSGNANNSSYNTPNAPANDNFGKNEAVTAVPTEEITQAPTNVKIEILSKKFGSENDGYVSVTDVSTYVDTLGKLCISVTATKTRMGEKSYGDPPIPYRVYDSSGRELWSNNIYLDNFKNKEVGDTAKGSTSTYIEPYKIATVEIG